MARNVREGDSSRVIPVHEESLKVETREHVTGKVRVDLQTETQEQVVERDLDTIYAHVTRVPVGRDLERGAEIPQMRTEEGLTIIPVLEEVLVVETRLRLVEEIHIKQQKTTERVTTPVTLRRQTATIGQQVEPLTDDNPKER